MNLKVRLTAMNFLEFAVWGAYLTSMGRYLGEIGLGANIGFFYSIQGIVSLFMPAIIGIVADRWVQAQKMLGYCHLMAGGLMVALAWYCMTNAQAIDTSVVFSLYSLSVAMPRISPFCGFIRMTPTLSAPT